MTIPASCVVYPASTPQRVKSERALVPTGPRFRFQVPRCYLQLQRRMVSFGDQGQVELKDSLKQVLNDRGPQGTVRRNKVALKILHPQRQWLCPLFFFSFFLFVNTRSWDSKVRFLLALVPLYILKRYLLRPNHSGSRIIRDPVSWWEAVI